MRAAVLHATDQPMRVEELELDPPGPGEVLVRIEAAGVCHSDLHYARGELVAQLPIVLGHEGAGIVEELGPGTTGRIAVGDRVALLWRPRCGECDACLGGNPALCRLGQVLAASNGLLDGTTRLHADGLPVHHLMGVSCFAERVVVAESSVVLVPDGVPPEIAAISACAVITGVGAAINAVEHGAGRPLVVVGAGGVGLSAVMGAALIGASPVIAVDVDAAKLEAALAAGASRVVDATAHDVATAIRELTGGAGAPWIVDTVGSPATLEQSLTALAPSGTLVVVGLGRAGASFAVPINDLVQRQKRVVGALYGVSNPRLDLPRIFELYLAGRLPLDALIGARRRLDDVDDALAALGPGRSGAAIIGRTVIVP